MICTVVLSESCFYSGSVDCFCGRKFACWATIVLGSARTEQAACRIEHGPNKSFDEVQFSNFRAEMSSKTISFHQPSQPSLALSFSLPIPLLVL